MVWKLKEAETEGDGIFRERVQARVAVIVSPISWMNRRRCDGRKVFSDGRKAWWVEGWSEVRRFEVRLKMSGRIWRNVGTVNVYKGKGDGLTCSSYRGIKLVEHAMKVVERIIENWVENILRIYNMQFGFMAGMDAKYIVRLLQEKYLAKKKRSLDGFCGFKESFWQSLYFLVRWSGGLWAYAGRWWDELY